MLLSRVFILTMLATSIRAKPSQKTIRGIMTWYSTEDNNSNIGAYDNTLVPFRSVARHKGSSLRYKTRLYIPLLKGFPLGKGHGVHDGWVRVEDECHAASCKMLDIYVGSNEARDRYRTWMAGRRHVKDPDQMHVTASY